MASDKNTPEFGGGRQHHLRDFSHHFSISGLICSLFTQFSGKVIGTDTDGTLLRPLPNVKDNELIGDNLPQKLFYGIVNWFFHMVSDMAGSNATAGKGTGIPGPILSCIKKLSVIPCFRDKKIGEVEFHTWVSKLFNGTLLAKRDENGKIIQPIPFDLRTEIGLIHEIGRQSFPVLINECLVRASYFIHRTYLEFRRVEVKSLHDLSEINGAVLLPFNNRIVRRMVTVSSGVFVVADLSGAAVRAAIKNHGFKNEAVKDFIAGINIIGIGRFAIACIMDARYTSEDVKKDIEKRNRQETEKEKEIIRKKLEVAVAADDMPTVNSLREKLNRLSNFVGVACTRIGAIMNGAVSTIKIFVDGIRQASHPESGVENDSSDWLTDKLMSGATSLSAIAVKKAMNNASSKTLQALSKTALPKQMVSTTVNVAKVMGKFIKGEITGTECIVQLGEDGFGELGAVMYSTAFSAAVKGIGSRALTFVAGAAGSTIGYMAAVAVYQELKTSLTEYQLAVEHRKKVEAECTEAVGMIREYREQMIAEYERYFTEHLEVFRSGVDAMDDAVIAGDVNGFLASNAQIQEALGRKPQFRTQEEFDDLMTSEEDFIL